MAETAAGLTASRNFGPLQRGDVTWTDRLTVERLVDRLATHSGHRMLAPATADQLHDTVAEALGGPDASITLGYTTMVLTTHRR